MFYHVCQTSDHGKHHIWISNQRHSWGLSQNQPSAIHPLQTCCLLCTLHHMICSWGLYPNLDQPSLEDPNLLPSKKPSELRITALSGHPASKTLLVPPGLCLRKPDSINSITNHQRHSPNTLSFGFPWESARLFQKICYLGHSKDHNFRNSLLALTITEGFLILTLLPQDFFSLTQILKPCLKPAIWPCSAVSNTSACSLLSFPWSLSAMSSPFACMHLSFWAAVKAASKSAPKMLYLSPSITFVHLTPHLSV